MPSSLVRLVSSRGIHAASVVEAVQQLLTGGQLIDVRIRCGDHGPSDGIGAHKLVLAAASPKLLVGTLLFMDCTRVQHE